MQSPRIRQTKVVVHRRVKQQNGKDQRGDELIKISARLLLVHHFASGIRGRDRRGVVPRLADHGDNIVHRDKFRIQFQTHGLRSNGDVNIGYSLHFFHGALDVRGAPCAVHPHYIEEFFFHLFSPS